MRNETETSKFRITLNLTNTKRKEKSNITLEQQTKTNFENSKEKKQVLSNIASLALNRFSFILNT